MSILQAIILGIIQGITEFLPISSSGHLVIIPYLLGWDIPSEQVFPFDVLIQISTLIAVIVFYWRDLIEIGKSMIRGIRNRNLFDEIPSRTGWLAILATIPAGLVGLLLKDQIESAFSRPDIASSLLIVTAIFLLLSEKIGKKTRNLASLNWMDAVVMGFSQALAVFPGISRSGSTISGGLVRNLDRKTAGQFTFLMAIPIMTAAGLLSILDLLKIPNLTQFLPLMAVGFLTSGIVGFFAIKWLLGYISNHSLVPFAIYCLILGLGSLMLSANFSAVSANNDAAPSEKTYRISYSSNVAWIIPTVNQCSDKGPGALILLDSSDDKIVSAASDIHLSYDELLTYPEYSFTLGNDFLIVGVSQDSPILEITTDDLRNLYQGKLISFSDLKSSCESCVRDGVTDQMLEKPIRIWAYPSESSLQQSISDNFDIANISSDVYIAPNPTLMDQAVVLEESAIGIFPEQAVTSQIRIIKIIDASNQKPQLSIIASSTKEPDAFLTNYLECIQNNI